MNPHRQSPEDASAGLYKPPAAPAIILVEPQLGENIGAAARAMANFGLGELRLVNPRDGWPNAAARANAANASIIVDEAKVFHSFESAIADLHYLCATTARPRDMRKAVLTPESAAREIRLRSNTGQNCGVVFGRERSGLDNAQIALADAIVMAPVNPVFASLNLAQAVLLIGYEWRKQTMGSSLGRGTAFDGPGKEGLDLAGARPATQEELMGFFEHIERELDASGFFRPAEKRGVMVRNLRTMFKRLGATDQEVRTLRGIVASLTRTHRRRSE